jgi:hypothetical protein
VEYKYEKECAREGCFSVVFFNLPAGGPKYYRGPSLGKMYILFPYPSVALQRQIIYSPLPGMKK